MSRGEQPIEQEVRQAVALLEEACDMRKNEFPSINDLKDESKLDEFARELSKKIKEAVKLAGWRNNNVVAEKAGGISVPTVSRWFAEKDRPSIPYMGKLELLLESAKAMLPKEERGKIPQNISFENLGFYRFSHIAEQLRNASKLILIKSTRPFLASYDGNTRDRWLEHLKKNQSLEMHFIFPHPDLFSVSCNNRPGKATEDVPDYSFIPSEKWDATRVESLRIEFSRKASSYPPHDSFVKLKKNLCGTEFFDRVRGWGVKDRLTAIDLGLSNDFADAIIVVNEIPSDEGGVLKSVKCYYELSPAVYLSEQAKMGSEPPLAGNEMRIWMELSAKDMNDYWSVVESRISHVICSKEPPLDDDNIKPVVTSKEEANKIILVGKL